MLNVIEAEWKNEIPHSRMPSSLGFTHACRSMFATVDVLQKQVDVTMRSPQTRTLLLVENLKIHACVP